MQLHIFSNFVHFCSLFAGGWCWFDISASEHGDYRLGNAFILQLWACYQIRKLAGCASIERFLCHRLKRKMLGSDPGTYVSVCMSGSLTHGGGENVPGISGACATHNFTYLARGPWGSENIWDFLLLLAPFLLMRSIHFNLFSMLSTHRGPWVGQFTSREHRYPMLLITFSMLDFPYKVIYSWKLLLMTEMWMFMAIPFGPRI